MNIVRAFASFLITVLMVVSIFMVFRYVRYFFVTNKIRIQYCRIQMRNKWRNE